jgi:hypothetical protein
MKMSSEFGVKLFDTHPEVQVAVGNGLDLGDSDGIPWQKRPGFAGFFLSWRRLTTTLSSRLTSSPCNTIPWHTFVFDGAKFGRQVVIQYPSDQTWKAFHCSSMGNSYCVDYSLTINITDWSKRTSVQ